MKKYTINAIAVFFLAFAIVFFGNISDAKAIGITLTINFGKKTSEGDCAGRGLCSIVISASLRAAKPGSNSQVIEGEAEVKGDYLNIKLNEKIKEQGMNEKGQYIVPITSDFAIKENGIKKMGYKTLTFATGEVESDGKNIRIKILNKEKLEHKEK